MPVSNFQVNVNFSSVSRLARRYVALQRAVGDGQLFGELVEEVLNEIMLPIMRDYIRRDTNGGQPIDYTGSLERSLEFRTFKKGFIIEGELRANDYGKYIERGREQGEDHDFAEKVDDSQEFQRLLEWAEQKIGAADPRALAWNVHYAIYAEGLNADTTIVNSTLPHPFITDSFDVGLPIVRDRLRERLQEEINAIVGGGS